MDINLTDAQFLCALLIGIILLYFGIYSYLIVRNKDTYGVKLLDDVVIEATSSNDGGIHILIDGKNARSMYLNGGKYLTRIIEIDGIGYNFLYFQGDDSCEFYKKNSNGIYECKRVNVNFK